jgi:hypothetical protein
MSEWPEARQIASQYHSPGPAGIGFAQFASTGTVTPELWSNIRGIEREASEPYAEGWAEDMARLRELLSEAGIEESDDEDED